MSVLEALGRGLGGIVAPIAAEASLIRGATVFHADGKVVHADVAPVTAPEPLGALGAALAGPALVRFSNALRRTRPGHDPRDVLGASVRFRAGTATAQDLLFATFRHVWQLPFAPLLTNRRDFLANDYSTALPFHVPGTTDTYTFELVPEGGGADGRDRFDRLDRAIAAGHAVLTLLARRGSTSVPIATIALRGAADDDLPFNPYRDGAGIVPAGFFNAVRAAVYPASEIGKALAHGGVPRREHGGRRG